MKISTCGKGGSGKSTVVALLANAAQGRGHLSKERSEPWISWPAQSWSIRAAPTDGTPQIHPYKGIGIPSDDGDRTGSGIWDNH